MDSKREYFSDINLFLKLVLGHTFHFQTFRNKNSYVFSNQLNLKKMHFDRVKGLMQKENDFYQQVN